MCRILQYIKDYDSAKAAIESGRRKSSLDVLSALAKALNVSLDQIVTD
jgi:transcriptional regulator with XRE-family HTH domain